jgi:hypothetical protein
MDLWPRTLQQLLGKLAAVLPAHEKASGGQRFPTIFFLLRIQQVK